MDIYYINSNDDKVDFLRGNLSIQNIESLFSDEWEYTSINSIIFGGKVKKFFKGLQERNLKLSIFADSEKEFDATMKRLHDVFTYDIRTKQPGRLYVNKSYLECWLFSSTYSEYEDLFYATNKDYKIVAERPMWTTELTTTINGGTSVITNELDLPMPVSLAIRGPHDAPSVEIGDNVYSINYAIPEGGYIHIDGIKRTATLHYPDGTEQNVFGYRDTAYNLFEQLPPGAHEVTFNGTNPITITLFSERGEPSWM